jgi:hypothetical protein
VKFEIEGCGFKGNTLWFNTNEGNSMKAEDKIPGGIYTDSGVKK